MASAKKSFPQPLKLRQLLGPSFIILALGLGSGEVILWPYLASNYGLGIAWGALLGITFQFFMNMEIERYALVKGESVFVGIAKRWPLAVYWFIFSTFVCWALPGIVAASAKVLASVLGVPDQFKWIAIGMLIIIGLILSLGKTVYGMMERVTKTVLLLGVPFVFLLAVYLSHGADWQALAAGFVGEGNNYQFLPTGIALATFLAAFAYSGAGGNLNLTQSIYIKEKGYGMGKYSQKIVGLFRSAEKQQVTLAGEDCALTQENISRYKKWWRAINIEHFIVFWFLGLLSMSMLMLLAYATVYGMPGNAESISFVIREGLVIGEKLMPWVGTLFLVVVSIMLFQTQLGVLDSTSRIMAENVAIKRLKNNPNGKINLAKIYSFFVWAQIGFGIILFLANFYDPKTLIVLAAVLNAIAMVVHVALVNVLNHKVLAKPFQPHIMRKIIMFIVFIFLIGFSALVVLDKLNIYHFQV